MRLFTKIVSGFGLTAIICFIGVQFMTTRTKQQASKKALGPLQEEGSPVVQADLSAREMRQRVVETRAEVPQAAPSASARVAERPSSKPPELDRATEMAAILEGQYAVDDRPTRESVTREKAVEVLFSQPALNGKGHLEDLTCRQTICRGVIKIASQDNDGEVFGRTLLSPEFTGIVQDAVTVGSRQKLPDGTVVATFFIHPQSMNDMIGQ